MSAKSDDVVRFMYDRIEKDLYESPHGWRSPFLLPAVPVNLHGYFLQAIHTLVLDSIKSEGPAFAFVERSGAEKLEVSRVGERLYQLRGCESLISSFGYSEHVNAYLACWQQFGLAGIGDWGLSPLQPSREVVAALNNLLEGIRRECTSPAFRNRVRIRRERAKKNADQAGRRVSKMLATGDVLVLRMEFGCLDPSLPWPSENAVRLLADDMGRFVNRLSKRAGLFRNLIGHLAFLGAGVEKRDFYHVVFVFDGTELLDEYRLAAEIGFFWDRLVSNQQGRRGVFLDCRSSANDYRRKGVGRIAANDALLKKELSQGVFYLAKCSEYIRLADHQRVRSMTMGALRKRVEKVSKVSKDDAKKLGL